MRYIGSKATTLDALYKLVSRRCQNGTFCDAFGGIGTVGSFFKSKGYEVTTGDILTAAHYFQISKIVLRKIPAFSRLRASLGIPSATSIEEYLNNLSPQNGWLTRRYAIKRKFFSTHNAKILDACWSEISTWNHRRLITKNEKALLLASLIDSADRIANTAGTYYAYLKNPSRKSKRNFSFKLLKPIESQFRCHSRKTTAENLVRSKHFNILYLDPPYNERSYSQYYHLPETLALMDKQKVHGKSGISNRYPIQSEFNKSVKAANALEVLLSHASFDNLFFHYTDDGLIPPEKIRKILSSHGKIRKYTLASSGYTTTSKARSCKHVVYVVSNA
jgi:adenine-specific DNA-methyltransferase